VRGKVDHFIGKRVVGHVFEIGVGLAHLVAVAQTGG
jgi:hypothetical protein